MTTTTLAAEETEPSGIDAAVNDAVGPIATWIEGIVFYKFEVYGVGIPVIVLWLITGAVFTIYLGFKNIVGFKHAIDLVRGRYSHPEDAGEVSHFQALATAVSGTVGLGNIAGGRGGDQPRRTGCNVLDDRRGVLRDEPENGRMHAGSEIPQGTRRRLGVRRPDVLPAGRHREIG